MSNSHLFIIDGISSVWKQDLVHYVNHVLVNGVVLRKLTTRNPRSPEDFGLLDLEHVDSATFNQVRPDYAYDYGDEHYGFQKSRVTECLRDYDKVFVIVRNAEVIRQLKADFKHHWPTSVFVHMDIRLAENRTLALKNPAVRDSVKHAFLDYLRDPECYDHIIINGGSRNDFFRLFDSLVKRTARHALALVEDSDSKYLLVITSSSTRRIAQIVLAGLSTVSVGFGVNLVTSGALNYWSKICLILDSIILVITLLLQLVLAKSWKENP